MASDHGRGGDSGSFLHCSFCQKSQHEVRKLIAGSGVHICDECVELCNDIIREEVQPGSEGKDSDKLPTPKEIKHILDDYVIHQEYAKKVLSVAVYNHYKRLNYKGRKDDVELSKSNILLIGPTGCGKTLLCRDARSAARRAVHHCRRDDAHGSRLRRRGRGEHHPEAAPEVRLRVERAQVGIVYIDGSTRSPASPTIRPLPGMSPARACSRPLLKLIEGTIASVPPRAAASTRSRSSCRWTRRTSCSFAGGAFSGLDKVIMDRSDKSGMGFLADPDVSRKDPQTIGRTLRRLEPEDLIKYGLIPEFVGRLPVVATLEELDTEALMRILTEPKNSLTRQYTKIFEMEGIEVDFREDALHAVAEKAMERKTGARAACARFWSRCCSTPCTNCRRRSP